MSEQLDLSTLPNRMRYAASVLEEAVKYADLSADTDWTPQLLRGDADIWEAEDRSRAEIDEQVELLARQIYGYGRAEGLHSHRITFEEFRGNLAILKTARRLIEKGWRKGDPE